MKAAVVEAFDVPPRYRDFDEPHALGDEVIVDVHAAALSQLVRAQAAGKHYTSGEPPFVPGADGVGRLANGERVYFAFPRGPVGAMAERVAVKSAHTVALPDDVDDITAAAIANPAMSSWAALSERVLFKSGESILINGANGVSGRLAIQIAKHLGAKRVIATARNSASEAELIALGADVFISLSQSSALLADQFRQEIARGVDVVLDYVWGPAAEAFFLAAAGYGSGDAARRIRFVNIGSLGGASIAFSASTLRSSGIEIVGSGLGSLSTLALVRSVGSLMQVVNSLKLRINTESVALEHVEAMWSRDSGARIVFKI
ncbi:MAG: alcohol dehydrogenase [Verrucomicrobiaceae bacterium]|nr:alcohol dehydrogenase [Verrucomicrobiaceae bacterium]